MERTGVLKDEEIISHFHKAQQGDQDAFKEVIRAYQRKVFALAFSFFRNREEALDIVQEAFLRLYQRMGMFKKERNLQNWILKIAKNLCIDHYRKDHHRRREMESGLNIEDTGLNTANESNQNHSTDIKIILTDCVKRLAERQRLIFVMRHYNQLKNEEIAQVLNISLGTVKSLHFKAVRNLRQMMTPYLGRQQ